VRIDEVDPRRRLLAPDMGRVDALARPERHQFVAEGVSPDRRQIADPRPLPRRRYGRVRTVAAEARQVVRADLGMLGADELDQRLAQAEDVGAAGQAVPRSAATWPSSARAASAMSPGRPAATASSSTSLPPMPTQSAPAAM